MLVKQRTRSNQRPCDYRGITHHQMAPPTVPDPLMDAPLLRVIQGENGGARLPTRPVGLRTRLQKV